jgi:hypothetical protein
MRHGLETDLRTRGPPASRQDGDRPAYAHVVCFYLVLLPVFLFFYFFISSPPVCAEPLLTGARATETTGGGAQSPRGLGGDSNPLGPQLGKLKSLLAGVR